MNDSNQSNLVDHGDFCRSCRGTGGKPTREWSDHSNRMVDVTYPCMFCEGTGLRTVRVLT